MVGCGEGYVANNNITFRNLVGVLLSQALNVTIVGNEVNSNGNNGVLAVIIRMSIPIGMGYRYRIGPRA